MTRRGRKSVIGLEHRSTYTLACRSRLTLLILVILVHLHLLVFILITIRLSPLLIPALLLSLAFGLPIPLPLALFFLLPLLLELGVLLLGPRSSNDLVLLPRRLVARRFGVIQGRILGSKGRTGLCFGIIDPLEISPNRATTRTRGQEQVIPQKRVVRGRKGEQRRWTHQRPPVKLFPDKSPHGRRRARLLCKDDERLSSIVVALLGYDVDPGPAASMNVS